VEARVISIWERQSGAPSPIIGLAAAYGLKGESDRAAGELVEARRRIGVDPLRLSSIARITADRSFMAPKVQALFEATVDVVCARRGCRRSSEGPRRVLKTGT